MGVNLFSLGSISVFFHFSGVSIEAGEIVELQTKILKFCDYINPENRNDKIMLYIVFSKKLLSSSLVGIHVCFMSELIFNCIHGHRRFTTQFS